MTLARRHTVAGAVVILAGGFSLAFATPAQAAGCPSGSGVTVVIDTGSSISTRCAAGSPGSAMSALTSVASVTTPQRFPGSVVCRIDGVPADDPCVVMPPATAYWSIWTAGAGGSWAYATVGANSLRPPAGSVVGFRFGAGSSPRLAPPAAPRPSVTPTNRATPRATPRPSSGSGGASRGGASGGGSTLRPPDGAAPRASDTRPGATASASRSASRSASATPAASASGSVSGSGAPSDGSRPSAVAAPESAADAANPTRTGWGPSAAAVALLGLLGFAGFAARNQR